MTRDELFQADMARDIALTCRPLAAPHATRFAEEGAHDPTPTPPYFVLDELLAPLHLGSGDHLLDVGCGCGRRARLYAGALPRRRLRPASSSILSSPASRRRGRNHVPTSRSGRQACSIWTLRPTPTSTSSIPSTQRCSPAFSTSLRARPGAPSRSSICPTTARPYSYLGRAGFSLILEGSYPELLHGGRSGGRGLRLPAALVPLALHTLIRVSCSSKRTTAELRWWWHTARPLPPVASACCRQRRRPTFPPFATASLSSFRSIFLQGALMSQLYLVRHGQTLFNALRRKQGLVRLAPHRGGVSSRPTSLAKVLRERSITLRPLLLISRRARLRHARDCAR